MKVAIVHDYLNQYGGAERVLDEIKMLYPDAPVLVSIYDPNKMPAIYRDWDVRASWLNRVPFANRKHQALLPFYPQVFENFDLSDYDLVVSSSSGFAHGVLTGPNTTHVCYCHSPPRFLWDYHKYAERERMGRMARSLVSQRLAQLRLWDRVSADRADAWISTSRVVRERIKKFYGKDSAIIPPPVNTRRFDIGEGPGDYYLMLMRLVGWKRPDIVVEACTRMGLPLVVAGDGRELDHIRQMAGPTVKFVGRVNDAQMRVLYRDCKALILPSEEDFGITPLESMSAGRPVIAYGRGGVLDTINPEVTGLFFEEQTAESLAGVLSAFERRTFNAVAIRAHAEQYDSVVFRDRLGRFIDQQLAAREAESTMPRISSGAGEGFGGVAVQEADLGTTAMRGLSFVRGVAGGVLRAEGGLMAMLQTVIAQGLTVAVNVATGVITARLLGATGRGEFAAAVLWLLLPGMFAISGIQNAVLYEARREPENGPSAAAGGFLLTTAVFIPIALVCAALLPYLLRDYPADILHLAETVNIIAIINAWTVIGRQSLLADRDFRSYNMSGYGSAFVYLVFLLAVMALHDVTPASAVWAQVAASTVVLVLTVAKATKGWRWRALRPFASLRQMVAYSLRSAPIDVVGQLAGNIDRLVLVGLISPAAFGLYAVSISFSRLLSVLQVAVSAVMFADLASRPKIEIQKFVHRAFRLLLWGLMAVAAFLTLFDHRLLSFVYGGDFGEAVPIFRILLIDASLGCLAQVVTQAYLAAGRPSYASSIQVASFGITLGMMFLLAPRYGAMGAAGALVAGSLTKTISLIGFLPRIGIAMPGLFPRLEDLDTIREKLRGSRGNGTRPQEAAREVGNAD